MIRNITDAVCVALLVGACSYPGIPDYVRLDTELRARAAAGESAQAPAIVTHLEYCQKTGDAASRVSTRNQHWAYGFYSAALGATVASALIAADSDNSYTARMFSIALPFFSGAAIVTAQGFMKRRAAADLLAAESVPTGSDPVAVMGRCAAAVQKFNASRDDVSALAESLLKSPQ
jgi:hypothetical protein